MFPWFWCSCDIKSPDQKTWHWLDGGARSHSCTSIIHHVTDRQRNERALGSTFAQVYRLFFPSLAQFFFPSLSSRASREWLEYSLIRMTSHVKEWENERMPQPQYSFIWSNRFNAQNWTVLHDIGDNLRLKFKFGRRDYCQWDGNAICVANIMQNSAILGIEECIFPHSNA